ncbi:MAG: UDP-2,3-diacylglucosamine diphosphatase LpxI domain-containing protein [Gemmobacter sp.]
MGQIAVIAGAGALPGAVAAALGGAPVFSPEGVAVAVPAERFRFERLVPFLAMLADRGIGGVVLAGAMTRPRLDPALFDAATAQLVPRLVAAMQAGDDATLRAVVAVIEEAGLNVLGLAEVAPELIPGAGVLGAVQPGAQDKADVARAAAVVAALGAVDVGQGAVVAQGLCLAVEALPGTDAMLDWVVAVAGRLRPPGARGVLWKAPKPGQDLRVDLPALGPETVRRAAAAGLAGIAWPAGGAVVLDRDAMVAAADAAGLFLWAREP